MFWTEPDPQRKAEKRRDFLTDLSLLGGLIIASADTAGKPSLGWRGRQAASRISEAVTEALPLGGSNEPLLDTEGLGEKIGHGIQVGAERGRELASAAAEKAPPGGGRPQARRRMGRQRSGTRTRRNRSSAGAELVQTARERGSELAETARERGEELAGAARKRVKTRRKR
ncbi:putative membrane protein [Mycobacterium xenopi 4042]|uniref:Putative membrane protein n=1 Tax=Mycobacterium xenopi 4042 TaxID=1299334 RepID=X8BFR3_MYCXE|nr:putative membrane protein [Mycobacterium xenopi 4042]